MAITIRSYQSSDYPELVALYKREDLYGGQFDEDRDSAERLEALIGQSPNAVLIAERDGRVCGTVSLFRDLRLAWLFRFAAEDDQVAKALYDYAVSVLAAEGHRQVLVYAPTGHVALDKRYDYLGFEQGETYTCYWKPIL